MSDAKRTIRATDPETGEELEVVYDPSTGLYEINGDDVIRAEPLETRPDATVFQRPADKKLFTVFHSDLHQLHN